MANPTEATDAVASLARIEVPKLLPVMFSGTASAALVNGSQGNYVLLVSSSNGIFSATPVDKDMPVELFANLVTEALANANTGMQTMPV